MPFSSLRLSAPDPARWYPAPLLPNMGLYNLLTAWEGQTRGARGDRETESTCPLLISVLMPFTLPCSNNRTASHGTWEDVTRGVCCPASNKGTATQASSSKHQELPCPAEKLPVFNFSLAKVAASKKSNGGLK